MKRNVGVKKSTVIFTQEVPHVPQDKQNCVPITIRLTDTMVERIEQKAREMCVNRNDVIKYALSMFISYES